MFAVPRRTVLVLAVWVATAGAGATALADGPVHWLTDEPVLGFQYYPDSWGGYHVAKVWPGRPAARIGFERGDVIVSINGYRLNEVGDHEPALRQAVYWQGWFWFVVRDVRTGRYVSRWANMYY